MKRLAPLIAILSALALGASIVRGLAQWQLVATTNGAFTARTLVLLEVGNWLGWTAWAVILAASMMGAREGPGRWASIPFAVLLAVAPIIVVPLLSSPWHWIVTHSPGLAHSARHIAGYNLATNLLLGAAMVAVAQGRATRERARRLEQAAAELRAQLAESRLAVLRARLDPHFLFNALNSAMVLARRGDTARVERVIEHLAALLRYSLDEASAQVVPLRVELDALRHYLDLQLVRHVDRLSVRWNVEEGLGERPVPSLVMQPLAENAIQHGLGDGGRGLTVDIEIVRRGDQLELSVQDDGGGLAGAAHDQAAEGIGLGHTRARLAGLYGDRASLTLGGATGGRGTRVTVSIPAA